MEVEAGKGHVACLHTHIDFLSEAPGSCDRCANQIHLTGYLNLEERDTKEQGQFRINSADLWQWHTS